MVYRIWVLCVQLYCGPCVQGDTTEMGVGIELAHSILNHFYFVTLTHTWTHTYIIIIKWAGLSLVSNQIYTHTVLTHTAHTHSAHTHSTHTQCSHTQHTHTVLTHTAHTHSTHTCTHTPACTHTVHTHAHTHTCMRTHSTHTCTYTHIHTQTEDYVDLLVSTATGISKPYMYMD